MIKTEYIKSDGKIYEVKGRDGAGYPITVLTDLKEIPEDKPLSEEDAPKRKRKAE